MIRLKAYAVTYTIRESGEATVFARSVAEARRKFHNGEVESEEGLGDGRVTGIQTVRRMPEEDPE